MLRLNLFLVAILAINYVHSNVVIQPTEEQTIVPQTLLGEQTAPNVLLPANSISSPDVPLDGPVQPKKQRKPRLYYPVDLIGGPLGCVLLEELEKLGTVSKWYANSNLMTYQTCYRQCLSTRSMFAGLAKGNECLCSNSTLPLTTTFGKSDTNCTGSKHQKCGSATCAEYFTLKKNSDLLRQSLRLVDDPERWLHKNGWASWVRTNKGEFEHVFSEVFPLSSAIVTHYDCAAHPTAAAGCEDFYLIVTGYEDFIISKSGVRPITVEWDITFAGQKSSYGETDKLLVRQSACEWIYKEDEEIKRELLYLNFEFDKRTLVLVDKRDPTTIIRVNDNAYIESTSGVENKFTSFLGKWFNKATDRSFKDYFRGSYECQSDITNPWYQPPAPTVPTAAAQTVQTL